jgi:hypothetical protein
MAACQASLFSGTIVIGGTLARLGNVLLLGGNGRRDRPGRLAVLAYFTPTGSGALQSALLIVAFAGLVWLIGRAILYLLAGR